MKEKAIDIKTGGAVVATITVEQYETLDELLEGKLTPEQIVGYVNRMLATDKSNTERAKHRPDAASKQRRRTLATQLAFSSEEHREKLVDLMKPESDPDLLTAFLDSPEIQALVDAQITAGA